MSRVRSGASVLGAVALVVVAGCTVGGEDELVVDGSDDHTAVLAAAIETTLTETGRFEMRHSWEDDGTIIPVGAPRTTTATGEFSGSDVAVLTSDGHGDEEVVTEARLVGDVVYLTTESMTSMFDVMADPELIADPSFADVQGAFEQERAELERLFSGRKWVSFAPGAGTGAPDDPTGSNPGPGFDESPLELISDLVGSLESVSDEGTEAIDGVEHRKLRGRAPLELPVMDPEPDAPEPSPEMERMRRIEEFAADHNHREVTAWLSADGLVRRVEITDVSEVPEEYRECFMLAGSYRSRTGIDFVDLGSEVSIEAPDPAEVVSEDELRSSAFFGSEQTWIEEDTTGGIPSDGEWTEGDRTFLEAEVHDGAWVIGLDPAGIPEMSLDELVDASERIWDTAEELPTTETALGPMNRLELVNTVRMGMDMLGIDSSGVADVDDQQLADLITAYVESEDGLGPGGVGPRPTGMADEMFEGCPA